MGIEEIGDALIIRERGSFLFTDATGMSDLTPTADSAVAHDINDAGQVAGYRAGGTYHAFRWQAGQLQDLGVLPGMAHSFGFAISSSPRSVP